MEEQVGVDAHGRTGVEKGTNSFIFSSFCLMTQVGLMCDEMAYRDEILI